MTGEWDKAYQFSRGLVVIYNYGIALKCCTVSLRFLYGVEFGFAVHDKPCLRELERILSLCSWVG